MSTPLPRRPRRWSAACAAVLFRVALGLTLAALVAWPEEHVPVLEVANGPPGGCFAISKAPGGRVRRYFVVGIHETYASNARFVCRRSPRRVSAAPTLYETAAWVARETASRGLVPFRGSDTQITVVREATTWYVRDSGLDVILGSARW